MALFLCPKGHWLIRAMRGGVMQRLALLPGKGDILSRERMAPVFSHKCKGSCGTGAAGKAAPVALHGEGGYSLSRKRVSPFIRAALSAALPAAPVPQLPLHLCEKEKKGNKKPPPGSARASCCVVCVFLGGRKSHRGEFPFASIKIPVNLG